MIAAPKHIQTCGLLGQALSEQGGLDNNRSQELGQTPKHDWTHVTLKLRGMQLLVIALYLDSSIGPLAGPNILKLSQVGQLIRATSLPW
eukprot:8071347-Prorocentrum_lima.AAC.1